MNLRHLRATCMLLMLIAASAVAPAGAATTCTATALTLSFGTVSLDGITDVSATFQVTCRTFGLSLLANAKVRMCLNIGDGSSGGGNLDPRRMLSGSGDALRFQIYRDPARSQIWGSTGNPVVPTPLGLDFSYSVPLLGGTQTRTVTMYGRVPTQALVAGTYNSSFAGVHTSMAYRYNEALLGNPGFPATCTSGGIGGAHVSGAFPFSVSANVPTNCRAYVTTDLDFGTVPGLIDANRDRTSTIAMTCTGRTAWNVGLDNGQNAAGSLRRMRQGGSHVAYELYREPAMTSRWGTTIGTDTKSGIGTGATQTLTVHGRVPAGQTVPAGDYSDTITVTITY